MILVDTSVWVDFLNSAQSAAGDELERLIRVGAPLAVTGLIVAEVLQGLRREISPVTGILGRWRVLEPRGLATYEAAAAIFREARRRGITLTTVDAVIAALALDYGAALFTLDRDFWRLKFTGLLLHGAA
ncbi:MAG TPA: PIN domain nuclease [Terriglobia bacterium]|nr:PIN domain nuclease [Terriglobia bacterium]